MHGFRMTAEQTLCENGSTPWIPGFQGTGLPGGNGPVFPGHAPSTFVGGGYCFPRLVL